MTTIRDVAARAGVSIKTVSRVVNKSQNVSDYTRDMVLRAIEELDYRPNAFARGLVTKTSRMVGVTVPDICNPYFAEMVRGIEDTASERGYSVFICNTDEDSKKELDYLGVLQEKQVDGMILCSSRVSDGRIEKLVRAGVLLVLINREFELIPTSRIIVDEFSVGYRAVEHLLERGLERIGYLGGPGDRIQSRSKLAGYLRAFSEAGIKADPGWRVSGHPSIGGGYRATGELQEQGEISLLDALFTYNDLMAAGALDFLRERGMDVPGDLALIGCDDIPLASYLHPGLTTFRVPRYEMGRRALEVLLSQLSRRDDGEEVEGEEGPVFQLISPVLVERASTSDHRREEVGRS